MAQLAISSGPIRKRAKTSDKCDASIEPSSSEFTSTNITCLPVEIILEVFSYLSCNDLTTIGKVCILFQRLVEDPILWRTYEVTNNNGASTSEVIRKLKKMPFLRKFIIDGRVDCDDILRQISLTNKKLEELHVLNCTGSTANLYLRSGYLIRIVKKCRKLHTIKILGSRFRGSKFYQLLGDMGTRLRTMQTLTTGSQFATFLKHAKQINEVDRREISAMCTGVRTWAPLYYFLIKETGSESRAMISYLYEHASFNVCSPARKSNYRPS